MKPTVLFIVGAPAAGKSTLARALLATFETPAEMAHTSPHKWTVGDFTCAAGHYWTGGAGLVGSDFEGSDTIGYSAGADTIAYWASAGLSDRLLTIVDGDRLSNAKALAAFRAVVPRVLCANICNTGDADERRAARALRTGKAQNPSWCKGRETKANRFYDAFPDADRIALFTFTDVDEWVSDVLGRLL